MADFYLDVSAVGNEYQAYADTPASWAVPQDGNGKAGPGHAAAVAIATIDVAGCSASGTGTIGVLGVTVSSTLNASGAALATAIAAAINASATATTSTYCAALLPLNKLVYARVNPVLDTQVQIMLRIAGADWNGMAPTQANISPAATIGAFSGGADGPFVYYYNGVAVFGLSIGQYGVRVSKPACVINPKDTDKTHVRCARGGAPLTVSLSTSIGLTLGIPTSKTFIFDSLGTVWPGDAGQFTASINYTGGTVSAAVIQIRGASDGILRQIAGSPGGFRYLYQSTGVNAPLRILASTAYQPIYDEDCLVEEVNSTSQAYYSAGVNGQITTLTRPKFVLKSGHAPVSYPSNAGAGALTVYDIDLTYSGLNSDVPALFDNQSAQYFGHLCIKFVGGQITTGGAYSVLSGVAPALTTINSSGFSSIAFIGVRGLKNPTFGFLNTALYGSFSGVWEDPGVDKSFRYSVVLSPKTGYECDWLATATPPYPSLNSSTQSGLGMSVRVSWLPIVRPDFEVNPYTIEVVNRLGVGARTIVVNMLRESSVPCTTADVGFYVAYVDKDGVPRTQSTFPDWQDSAPSVANAAAIWANTPAGYEAMKFTIVTDYQVDANASIKLMFIERNPPLSSSSFFLDLLPGMT